MSYKYQIYILSGILAALVFALIFFGLKPTFSILDNKANDALSKRAEFEGLAFKKLTRDVLIESLKNTEADRIFLDKFFLKDKNVIDFLEAVEYLASNHGLKYYEINPAKKGENTEFSISVYDSFPKFMRFLSALENMDYLVKVKSINAIKISLKSFSSQKYPLLAEGDINAVIFISVGEK